MSLAIELEKVSKRFGNCLAVDNLDLTVPEGAIYGFIGPNGSGKTTTLRMLLRIIYPDTGRISVLGCDRGTAANDRIGYLPEERGLYRKMRVRMEERSQRIAEMLLGSVSPSQLMAGKLAGCVAGSLTIVAVYGVGALAVAQYYHVLHLVPLRIVPWFLVYQVLAVLLFSSLFMALGACVNDRKEAQSMQMPLMLLIVLPMFVWFNVVRQPTGSFATWVSFLPPGTAMLMVLRMAATPDVPVWQPVVGVLILLTATGVCVLAAGRVFRIAILARGQTPKFKQLLRWVITG